MIHKLCTVDGCNRKHEARGLCAMHYKRGKSDAGRKRASGNKRSCSMSVEICDCGMLFVKHGRRAYCSAPCSAQGRRLRRVTPRLCRECEVPIPLGDPKRWCPSCRDERDRRRMASHQANRRGARLAPGSEPIDPISIFNRDGWVCGCCGDPVDAALRWPHPRSRSLDHIIPLARGGAHNPGNVQLAHLRCNISKGAKVPVLV